MRRMHWLVAGTLLSLGCSFDTGYLTRNNGADTGTDAGNDLGQDVATDTGMDAGVDTAMADTGIDTGITDTGVEVAPDTGPADVAGDAGMTAVGFWRVVGVSTSMREYTTSGITRVNGLVEITPTTMALQNTLLLSNYPELTGCALGARTMDSKAAELSITLRESEGALDVHWTTSLTFTLHLSWSSSTSGPTLNVEIRGVPFIADSTLHLQRFDTFTPRLTYTQAVAIEYSDAAAICGADITSETNPPSQMAALFWERSPSSSGPGQLIQIGGPAMVLSRAMTSGISLASLATNLPDPPPVDARGTSDGIPTAVAYLIAWSDTVANGLLDHRWTGSADAGDAGETILGVSNIAIAWRGAEVPRGATHSGAFSETYRGYQACTIGIAVTSDGTSPWTMASPAGCFAEDPVLPMFAGGPIQSRATFSGAVSTLPDLLH